MEKIIPGFEDYSIHDDGTVYSRVRNKFLKARFISGYPNVLLYKDKKGYNKHIHRLVAQAFIPNPDNLPCINHINGIRHDNSLSNLEWCTHRHNMQHAWKTGLNRNTEKQRNAARISGMKVGGANRKLIVNTETGVFYNSVIEAAKAINMPYTTLTSQLRGIYPNTTPLRYA